MLTNRSSPSDRHRYAEEHDSDHEADSKAGDAEEDWEDADDDDEVDEEEAAAANKRKAVAKAKNMAQAVLTGQTDAATTVCHLSTQFF